jgi:hypothetical protein
MKKLDRRGVPGVSRNHPTAKEHRSSDRGKHHIKVKSAYELDEFKTRLRRRRALPAKSGHPLREQEGAAYVHTPGRGKSVQPPNTRNCLKGLKWWARQGLNL